MPIFYPFAVVKDPQHAIPRLITPCEPQSGETQEQAYTRLVAQHGFLNVLVGGMVKDPTTGERRERSEYFNPRVIVNPGTANPLRFALPVVVGGLSADIGTGTVGEDRSTPGV